MHFLKYFIMKKFNFYYLFVFITLGLVITGCDKDDPDHDDNKITITIEEPMDGETIARADCGEVHVHIEIEASEENHEVEILLHPEDHVNDKIIDYDIHKHDKVIMFEQEVDLCKYAAGTCFHLEVEACVDHDCEEKARADVEFCLQ